MRTHEQLSWILGGMSLVGRLCGTCIFIQSMTKYDNSKHNALKKGKPNMADIERITITLSTDMATVVRRAVEDGDYVSTSEVVRAALRDWKMKRALQLEELASLKSDIDEGLADIANGRVKDFDVDQIIKRGKKLLADRSPFV